MTGRIEISQAVLKELMYYDPETGIFVWKERSASWFKRERDKNAWNAHYSGQRAGSVASTGYIDIGIQDKIYRAHILAWIYCFGQRPSHDIDHINGDRSDNRLSNLRPADRSINGRNQGIPIHNSSGVMGVHWMERIKKWQARIMASGKRLHLGYFENFDDAVKARRDAEMVHHYHPNHGARQSHKG